MAGYAWDWDKNLVDGELPNDVVIEDIDFAMPWNNPSRIDWVIHPYCSGQLGCIHTVQGLEMEYAGVIIGNDFVYDPETKSLVVRRKYFKEKGVRPTKPKGAKQICWINW